jgi:hypothetical protein
MRGNHSQSRGKWEREAKRWERKQLKARRHAAKKTLKPDPSAQTGSAGLHCGPRGFVQAGWQDC